MECFRLLFDHLAWIEHKFLSGIRDSRKAGSLWGMIRGMGGVRKSIHQCWLAKWLGLRLLCWRFKGLQEEIPSEEAIKPQIRSVVFPPGQYTSPQLYPCQRLFDKMGIKTVTQTPYSPDLAPCDFWLFPKFRGCRYKTIEEMKEAVTRGLPWGHPEVVGTVQQVHCSRKRFLRRGQEFQMCTINKSAHTKKVWKLIVCTSYTDWSSAER